MTHDERRELPRALARFGQISRRSVDQFGTEIALKARYTIGDIRLHGPERFSGTREGPVLGDADQGFQLADLHVSSIEMERISPIRLRDTQRTGILISACFTQTPP